MSVDNPVRRVHNALEAKGCHPRGEVWKFVAHCPAHEDRNPSLAIEEGCDRRVLIHCRAGCRTENVVAALGMTMADLFPLGHRKGFQPRPVVRRAKSPGEALIMALNI